MRSLLATLAAVLLLAACSGAPAAPNTVDLDGRLSVTASAGAERGLVISVTGEGMLPLRTTDAPPVAASGVVIEVPDDLALPDDPHERFLALAEYSAAHEFSYEVVSFR